MDIRTETYRRIRGAILKVLAREYPHGAVDAKIISLLIEDLGFKAGESECEGHLAYLVDKKYAVKDERVSSGIRITLASITPSGLDLLDGFLQDVGVNVRF